MPTITFDGESQEEVKKKKDDWLSNHPTARVRDIRMFPLARGRNGFSYMDGQAPVPTRIEIDYESLD